MANQQKISPSKISGYTIATSRINFCDSSVNFYYIKKVNSTLKFKLNFADRVHIITSLQLLWLYITKSNKCNVIIIIMVCNRLVVLCITVLYCLDSSRSLVTSLHINLKQLYWSISTYAP